METLIQRARLNLGIAELAKQEVQEHLVDQGVPEDSAFLAIIAASILLKDEDEAIINKIER